MPDIRRTGLLDDFKRDEQPMFYDGRWLPIDYAQTGELRTVFDEMADEGVCELSEDLSKIAYSYWTAGPPSPVSADWEVWGNHAGSFDDGSSSQLWAVDPATVGGSNAANGYALRVVNTFSFMGLQIRRYDGFSANVLASEAGAYGHGILYFRRRGGMLEGWRSADGGLTFTKLIEAGDSTYTGAMRFGLGHSVAVAHTDGWKSFGAGPIIQSQIYRLLRN